MQSNQLTLAAGTINTTGSHVSQNYKEICIKFGCNRIIYNMSTKQKQTKNAALLFYKHQTIFQFQQCGKKTVH
jgi:hypothetical protein